MHRYAPRTQQREKRRISSVPARRSQEGPKMTDAMALPRRDTEEAPRLQREDPFPTAQPSPMEAWESTARAWLSSLTGNRRPPSPAEMDAWLDSAQPPLPEELRSLSRSQLHQWILAVDGSLRVGEPTQAPPPEGLGTEVGPMGDDGDRGDGPRGRFQRAEHWNPVYAWLESLDTDEVVGANDVKDWFLANPEIKENLSRNSRYHLLHYIQRVHMKILRRKGRVQKGVQKCKTRTALRILSNGLRARAPIPCKFSSRIPNDKDLTLFKKNEAFLRYELLTDLQNQLASIVSKNIHLNDLVKAYSPGLATPRSVENVNYCSVGNAEKQNLGTMSVTESHSNNVENSLIAGQPESNAGLKRKRNATVAAPAWSYCEASFGSLPFRVGSFC